MLRILPTYAVGFQLGLVSLQIVKEKRTIFDIRVLEMLAAFEYHKAVTHTMIIKYSIEDIKVLLVLLPSTSKISTIITLDADLLGALCCPG